MRLFHNLLFVRHFWPHGFILLNFASSEGNLDLQSLQFSSVTVLMIPGGFRCELLLPTQTLLFRLLTLKLNFFSSIRTWENFILLSLFRDVVLDIDDLTIRKSLRFRIEKDIGKSTKHWHLFIVLDIIARHVSSFAVLATRAADYVFGGKKKTQKLKNCFFSSITFVPNRI